MKYLSGILVAFTVITSPLSADLEIPETKFVFEFVGHEIMEDFSDYRGTAETVPLGLEIGLTSGSNVFQGVFNSTTGIPSGFSGLMAATSDGVNYSFGIRERTDPVNLTDGRIRILIKNDTDQPISRFAVSYDIEGWVNGRRDNRIRLKYDIYPGDDEAIAAEDRLAFETDIVSSLHPNHTFISNNNQEFVKDGKLPANWTAVTVIVDLNLLLVSENEPGLGSFGALEPGETAYFRFQKSNGNLGAGSRSALAVDNLSIAALDDAPPLQWRPSVGGSGAWFPTGGIDWSGGEWLNGSPALFGDAAGTVTVTGGISTSRLHFSTTGYTIAGATENPLAVTGPIITPAGISATLAARLSSASQLTKTGAGSLTIAAAQMHGGTARVAGGTLQVAENDLLSPQAILEIDPEAFFLMNNTTQTVRALRGQVGDGVSGSRTKGTLNLGSGTLIIDTELAEFYRGDIIGSGNIIKRGVGSQRFRSEPKTFSGFTRIEEGVLEATGNGRLANTSVVEVLADGELLLSEGNASGQTFEFGSGLTRVELYGGTIATESGDDELLYYLDNVIDVVDDNSTIAVRGAATTFEIDGDFGGGIEGAGLLRKTGQGILSLLSGVDKSGGWDIRNGSVVVQAGSTLGSGPLFFNAGSSDGLLILDGGTHTVTLLSADVNDSPETGEPIGSATIELNGGATFIVDQSEESIPEGSDGTRYQGSIVGIGGFVKSGTGLLRLTRGPNTYTGPTTVSGGVLELTVPSVPTATSAVAVGPGGQIRLTSANDGDNQPRTVMIGNNPVIQLNSLGRSGVDEEAGLGVLGAIRFGPGGSENTTILQNALSITGPSGLHVTGSGNTLELTGAVSGTGALVKSGGGTLVWPAVASPWNSDFEVNNGTLHIPAGGIIGGSGSNINVAGAILSGYGSLVGDVVMGEGALLSAGGTNPGEVGSLSVTGSLTFQSGAMMGDIFEGENQRVDVIGDLTFESGTFVIMSVDSVEESITVFTATGTITGVSLLSGVVFGADGASVSFAQVGNSVVATFGSVAPSPFQAFMASFGVTGDDALPLVDANGDGVVNLLKYYLGADPTLSAAAITELGSDGATFSFNHTINKDAPGVEGEYRWSLDLSDWFSEGESSNGISVSFAVEVTVIEDEDFNSVEVTATIETDEDVESPSSLFLRLEAMIPEGL